jgi:hypothetical protein
VTSKMTALLGRFHKHQAMSIIAEEVLLWITFGEALMVASQKSTNLTTSTGRYTRKGANPGEDLLLGDP